MATPATIFLVEWSPRSPDTNEPVTFYWSTDPGFRTGAAETPANQIYTPRVSSPGRLGRFIFGDGRTGGGSQFSVGNVRLRNADGALDDFIARDWGVDGAALRIYIGNTNMARADFTLVASATSEFLEADVEIGGSDSRTMLSIVISDPMSIFDKPAQTIKYLGTNVGPAGFEGTADTLKGTPKPFGGGVPKNVSAKLSNSSLLVFDGSDGPIWSVDNVYDNGVPLSDAGDVSTLSSLVSQSTSSGSFLSCLNAGKFKLGASPAGLVTADLTISANPMPWAGATDFNGTTQYLWNGDTRYRALGLGTGTGKGTLSAWIRVDGGDGTERAIFSMARTSPRPEWIGLDSSNRLIRVWDVGQSTYASTPITAGATWRHVAVSWNTTLGVTRIAIDGTSLVVVGVTGENSDQYHGYCGIGAAVDHVGSFSKFWNGCLAEVYYVPEYIDLSQPSRLQALRSSAGYPANLGLDGGAPTGTAALAYLRGYATQFAQNAGTGGAFTAVGTPTDATTTPYEDATSSTLIGGTAANLIRFIAQQRAGISDDQIDLAAFTALNSVAPEILGLFKDSEVNTREVLDEIAGSVGAWYGFTRDRLLTCGKVALPGITPSFTFDRSTILRLQARTPYDEGNGIPAYSAVVKYQKNYTVQGDGIAGSVSAERRVFLDKEFRQINDPDGSVRQRHPKSPEMTFDTLIDDPADAQNFHDDRRALYGRKNDRFLLTAPMIPSVMGIDLGHDVAIAYPRFGLNSGKMFKVIGVDPNNDQKQIVFDLAFGTSHSISGSAAGMATVTGHLQDIVASLLNGWWRADEVSYSSTGMVDQIHDLTGNGRPFVMLTEGSQPGWVSSEALINSKPYINFPGAGGVSSDPADGVWMSADYSGSLFFPSAYTIYAVLRPDSFNDYSTYAPALFTTNRVSADLGEGPNSFRLNQVDNTFTRQQVSKDVTAGDWIMVEMIGDGTSINVTVAGTSQVTTAMPGLAFTGLGTELWLGLSTDGSFYNFTDMGFAEMMVAGSVLSSGDRTTIRNYLATRYGISWDVPREERAIPGGEIRGLPGGDTRGIPGS